MKKIYFDDYRFSEDLDFTLLNNALANEQIFSRFRETFDYVQEGANIPLEIIDTNQHEDGGINFYISYTGPLAGQGANKRVKVDISRSEKLEYEPVMKDVIVKYSDMQAHELLCYPLEEVLVEKMRTVMQRMQARDFYDIWFLLEKHQMDAAFHMNEFARKCASKNLSHLDFPDKLAERLPQYKGRWQSSLREQIKDLPDFATVEREVQRHLKKLHLEMTIRSNGIKKNPENDEHLLKKRRQTKRRGRRL